MAEENGTNVLTRRIGPLPTWGWTAIVGGGVLVWAYWQNRKANQSENSATVPDTTPPNVFLIPPQQEDEEDDDTKKSPPAHHTKPKPRKHPTHDKSKDKLQVPRHPVSTRRPAPRSGRATVH